jgi:glyoxylase-like metal-dependent hydrolase (beta-lactamase superfamily II)
MDGEFNVRWVHGSADCATNKDPSCQIHSFDPDTYILRQNKCHTFEAPFLYLLFGSERALLLDTGDGHIPAGQPSVGEVVRGVIDRRQKAAGRSGIELVVAHTHGHGDHVAGDAEFAGRPGTRVVPLGVDGVRDFFGLAGWPDAEARLDLGGRELIVFPVPGHLEDHIAVYDPATGLLFTGDTVYPGYLYVRDWAAFRASVGRLHRFASAHPVRYLLGAHVEMTRTPGVAYPSPSTYQPDEHVLQLVPEHLAELHAAVERLGDRPARTVLDHFIIQPIG